MNVSKRALITGVTGQDGSYLAEYLLGLGYEVVGTARFPAPGLTPWWSDFAHRAVATGRFGLVVADMRDKLSLATAFQKAWPDEVYNLAGQVFVPTSWSNASETLNVNCGGLARLLAIVEHVKPDTRVYQASSSEMFGNVPGPLTEGHVFAPESPYGVSKLAAHHLASVYRQKGLAVYSGILMNHESPRRGPEMVTRKISRAVAHWAAAANASDARPLFLGNIEAKRDWGFAGDYVTAMHAVLQQTEDFSFVIGTGVAHTVRDFLSVAIDAAQAVLGRKLPVAVVTDNKELLRANEVHCLVADASKAREKLGWKSTMTFPDLVKLMVLSDMHFVRLPDAEDAAVRAEYARLLGAYTRARQQATAATEA